MNKNLILKRIISWIIDWILSGLPCFIYSAVFFQYFKRPSFETTGLILILTLLIILYPITFVLRDVIFKGRSVGKRIFKLYVVDKTTGEKASVKQRIVRNIFFLIYAIDGIILISTKESVGDKIANTKVVGKA